MLTKKKRSEVYNLNFYLKKLEREKQKKPKASSKRGIRTEINKTENRKTENKSMKLS